MSFQNNGNSLNGRNRYANSTIAYQLIRSQNIHNAPDAKILIENRNLCASTDDISEHPQCTNGNQPQWKINSCVSTCERAPRLQCSERKGSQWKLTRWALRTSKWSKRKEPLKNIHMLRITVVLRAHQVMDTLMFRSESLAFRAWLTFCELISRCATVDLSSLFLAFGAMQTFWQPISWYTKDMFDCNPLRSDHCRRSRAHQ